jgi:prevent-host-death family protein
MKERVTTLQVRAKLGDILNRVDLRHDEFVIERQGHPLAALVPVDKLERMEALAKRYALEALDAQKGGGLSQEEADALAREAVQNARRRRRKA